MHPCLVTLEDCAFYSEGEQSVNGERNQRRIGNRERNLASTSKRFYKGAARVHLLKQGFTQTQPTHGLHSRTCVSLFPLLSLSRRASQLLAINLRVSTEIRVLCFWRDSKTHHHQKHSITAAAGQITGRAVFEIDTARELL